MVICKEAHTRRIGGYTYGLELFLLDYREATVGPLKHTHRAAMRLTHRMRAGDL